jgi:small neutral amino acid transporter SnatA (MarC family)
MKTNVGKIDRIIRLVVAAVIAYLLFSGTVAISSLLGIILAVVAVIFAFTGLSGWCAIYQLLGASTCPIEKK